MTFKSPAIFPMGVRGRATRAAAPLAASMGDPRPMATKPWQPLSTYSLRICSTMATVGFASTWLKWTQPIPARSSASSSGGASVAPVRPAGPQHHPAYPALAQQPGNLLDTARPGYRDGPAPAQAAGADIEYRLEAAVIRALQVVHLPLPLYVVFILVNAVCRDNAAHTGNRVYVCISSDHGTGV